MIYSTDGFIEEKKKEFIRLEGAQIYIEEYKRAIEVKNTITVRPDIATLEEKLVAVQSEVSVTIAKMIKNEAALYKDEDSIVTIDNDVSINSNI